MSDASVQGELAVSVCMASYNGARHIESQLRSILNELHEGDEVVIVDDASTDGTVSTIESMRDSRIRLHRHVANEGYVRTFADALMLARGDVIFLADQDDEWIPGRRAALLGGLATADVVASDIVLLGTDEPLRSPLTGRPWRLRAAGPGKRRANAARMLLGIAPYYGCAMALRADVRELVLPFPEYLTESHDLWIAAAANATGRLGHVSTPTVRRRLHDDNASSARPRGAGKVLASRVLMVRLLLLARRRARRQLLGAR